ncbi:MAG: hypothetical protein ACP6IP_01150 [Candidatus Njordarchaeia archaeon]
MSCCFGKFSWKGLRKQLAFKPIGVKKKEAINVFYSLMEIMKYSTPRLSWKNSAKRLAI